MTPTRERRDGDGRHSKQAMQARRDIERLSEQSEKLFGAGDGEAAGDPQDRIEVIGRRIGRSLGYLIAAGLFVYLLATYVFASSGFG